MSTVIADPVELRARGFDALVAQLGWVNAVRFIQQYERGSGDYTRERDDLLPDWDPATLVSEATKQG
jgi:hypothetical protein